MTQDVVQILRSRGIQPSAQRVAVAQYVLHTDEHPSAEQVFARVRAVFPMLSRATVYNTLHLLVDKGLLRELAIAEGRVIFDPRTEPHHHLLDEETGAIHDIPWEALQVSRVEELTGFEVKEYQVLLRGRATGKRPSGS
jgi:Fe2+ or Zn2+ uptake regulation protein